MIHIIQQSCLEKISVKTTEFKEPYQFASALAGEKFAYQIILYSDLDLSEPVSFQYDCGAIIRLYEVKQVPVNWPFYFEDRYRHYSLQKPDLLPDALIPINHHKRLMINRNLTILWVEASAIFPGDYKIEFSFKSREETQTTLFTLRILPTRFEKPHFSLCQYIDPISIAAAYSVPMFSNVHWDMLKKNFELAAQHGVTDLLTPIFSPEYDYFPSNSEPVQLIKIYKDSDQYRFDYDLLDCWISLAKKSGISNFTFPPLFPSTRTLRCPKIVVTEGRREKLLFNEETDVLSPEFFQFLRKYLRGLVKHIKEIKVADSVRFQITDKPSLEYADNYSRCRSITSDIVNRYPISDTNVPYDFYEENIGSAPFFSMQDIEDLLKLPSDRYLCTDITTPNTLINFLIASPSVRIRSFGALCFRYRITSLFHLWYNNYFTGSEEPADVNTDPSNGNTFPSGSAFLVYPGKDGPIPTIRLKQLYYALQDYQVLHLLTKHIAYDRVMSRVKKKFSSEKLPVTAEEFLQFRDEIYSLFEKAVIK